MNLMIKYMCFDFVHIHAEVAELADAVDSKSTGARLCAGSSPALGTRVPNIVKREQKSGGFESTAF